VRKRRIVRWIIGLLLVLLGSPVSYMGTYYALVFEEPNLRCPGCNFVRYRYGGAVSSKVFLPAHELDEWIRPGFWKPHPDELHLWDYLSYPEKVRYYFWILRWAVVKEFRELVK
jgi:hypothetical protein